MKKLFLLCILGLMIIAGLPAQYRYDFFDGFSLYFDDPDYTITDIHTLQARETDIEIVSPDGSTIYGSIFYIEDTIDSDIKGKMINAVRTLYHDELEGYGDETIHIVYDLTKKTDTDAYWIDISYGHGEEAFSVLGLDLSLSPGTAELILFSFPPFFGLTAEEEYEILYDLFSDIRIVFQSAAG